VTTRHLAALVLLAACAQASAETLTCTEITSLPYTVSTGGTYCLSHHLSHSSTSGAAITIKASNVRLDCNDHALINTATSGTAIGLYAAARSNVVVENCRIKGYHEGIRFDPQSSDVVIRNNIIQKPRHLGIIVWASRAQVLNNQIIDQHYSSTSQDYNQAIYMAPYSTASGSTSRNVVIQGNKVLGIGGTLNMQAIRIDNADSPLVSGNHIGSLVPKSGGKAYGILINNSKKAVIKGNVITSDPSVNLSGMGFASGTDAVCVNNMLSGARFVGLSSCSLSQGNVYK
jgi:hypothetical protein